MPPQWTALVRETAAASCDVCAHSLARGWGGSSAVSNSHGIVVAGQEEGAVWRPLHPLEEVGVGSRRSCAGGEGGKGGGGGAVVR